MKRLIQVIKEKKIFFLLFLLFLIIGLILLQLNEKAFLIIYFDNSRTDFFNKFFITATKLGEYYPFVFFFFYYLYKRSRISFSIAALGAIMPLISYFLKQFFTHPRPIIYFYKYLNEFPIKGIDDLHYYSGHNSFPSGHTLAAFAIFTLLVMCTKSKALQFIYFLLALLVAISRVYLVQHFLEDVVFGASIGIILGILIYYLFFIVFANKSYLDVKFKSIKD